MLIDSLQIYLTSVPAIVAAVGTPATRSDWMSGIFPILAPDAASIPYIVLQQMTGLPLITLDGFNRFVSSRWRFSVYGSPYKPTKLLAKLLKDAMTGIPLGVSLPPVTLSANGGVSIVIQAVVPVMLDVDDAEEIPHGTIFGVHNDFVIAFIDNEG